MKSSRKKSVGSGAGTRSKKSASPTSGGSAKGRSYQRKGSEEKERTDRARAQKIAKWSKLALATAEGGLESQRSFLAAIDPEIKRMVRLRFGALDGRRAVADVTPEDLTQEVRAAVIKGVSRWKPTGSLEAWLKRIVDNRFKSLLRRADVRRRGGTPATAAESTAESFESAEAGDDPTIDRWTNRYSVRTVAAHRETRAMTLAAVEKLDKRLGRVFDLLYVQEVGRIEAARKMGISVRALYDLECQLEDGVQQILPSKSRLAIRGLSSGPGEKVRRDVRHR